MRYYISNQFSRINFDNFILSIIIFIAVSFRLYSLGDTSLWYDEAVYATNSLVSFDKFLFNTRFNNSSPILMPFLLWLLYQVFGELMHDAFVIRLLPLIFGVLSVVFVFKLKDVGTPRVVAIFSALWMALMPIQIQYSQELREYSLSIFITCLLVYYFLEKKNFYKGVATDLKLCCILFIAPLASYGNIIVMTSIAFLMLLESKDFKDTLIFLFVGALGMLASYFITAKFQMHVAKAWYLVDYYPPSSDVVMWFIHAYANYIEYMIDGIKSNMVFIVPIVYMTSLCLGYGKGNGVNYLSRIFILTIFVSSILSFFGAYPFGGIRQHLFSIPLVLVTFVSSLWFVCCRWPYSVICLVLSVALLVLPDTLLKWRWIYFEAEDIVSAVTALDEETKDSSVYIYYASIPAVSFHFPSRNFHYSNSSRGQVNSMAHEILSLDGCKRSIIFSHVHNGEDELILMELINSDFKVNKDLKFKESRMIALSRC